MMQLGRVVGRTNIVNCSRQQPAPTLVLKTLNAKSTTFSLVNLNYLGQLTLDSSNGGIEIKNLSAPESSQVQSMSGSPGFKYIGSRLTQLAVEHSIASGQEGRLTLNADPQAITFWTKMGFEANGEEFGYGTLPMYLPPVSIQRWSKRINLYPILEQRPTIHQNPSSRSALGKICSFFSLDFPSSKTQQ